MKSIADPRVLDELILRLRRLGADSERLWGKMTLAEMLCHLADAGDNVLAAKMLPPTNGLKARILKNVALYLPIPWPKSVVGRPGPRSLPGEYEKERERVIGGLERLATPRLEGVAAGHPLFGQMSLADWQRWAFLHVDHHLRQFGE